MFRLGKKNIGAAPGLEHSEIIDQPTSDGQVNLTCIDYNASEVQIQEIDNLDAFLAEHRPEWSAVRWIRVVGFADMRVIQALATKYNLHPLAIEDVLHQAQRPKVEAYGGEESDLQARLFLVAHAYEVQSKRLSGVQISLFLGHRTVLTFQEVPCSIWNPIVQRIRARNSRLRTSDASFLMYSLLDAIIDHYFLVLEHYGELAEDLDDRLMDNTSRIAIHEIHQLKRDLLQLHKVIWPMREVVSLLQRDPHETISDQTRVYLRDLYDHVIQIIDIVEIYREMASDLTETYMSSVSNRMNEIMKVLTMIGTLFIPLTFLAGVYGMNFRHFPELDQRWAYPAFWLVCGLVAAVMFFLFRRKNWM